MTFVLFVDCSGAVDNVVTTFVVWPHYDTLKLFVNIADADTAAAIAADAAIPYQLSESRI